jgi:preprotein translocase subunit SecG
MPVHGPIRSPGTSTRAMTGTVRRDSYNQGFPKRNFAVTPLFAASALTILLNTLVLICTVLLIFIVLIQRGKGGGLVGALGGAGGSSAFGSRAGDQFTKITLYMAAFWLVFIMIQVKIAKYNDIPPPPAIVVDPTPTPES